MPSHRGIDSDAVSEVNTPTVEKISNEGRECSLVSLLPAEGCVHSENVCPVDIRVPLRRLKVGTRLFWAGDEFHALYEVRAGAVMSFRISENGEEHISGFYVAGEIVGLEALHLGHYPVTAIALQNCRVREIPIDKLEALVRHNPQIGNRLIRQMSEALNSGLGIRQVVARGSAEEKLAVALLNLAQRCDRNDAGHPCFKLPMARMDLADYLGLAAETVSRVFKRFQDNGWICAHDRDIELIDITALQSIASLE